MNFPDRLTWDTAWDGEDRISKIAGKVSAKAFDTLFQAKTTVKL